MNKILPFSSHVTVTEEETRELMGSRGRRAMELSELDLPICPGFIIPNEALQHFPDEPDAGWKRLHDSVEKIESIMSKNYSDTTNPLLLKVVETGSTLKAHNLSVLEELATTEVRLIANKPYYKYHFRRIETLLEQLRSRGADEYHD